MFLRQYALAITCQCTLDKIKKTLWPLFYGWGSTVSRLEPLQGDSLLFTSKFPEISGTHFTDLGR